MLCWLAEEPVRVCLCALFVFEENGDMRPISRITSKGKQPREKHSAYIFIGGVILEDYACWRNCGVFACAYCKFIVDEKRLLRPMNTPEMQVDRISVPAPWDAQFLIL